MALQRSGISEISGFQIDGGLLGIIRFECTCRLQWLRTGLSGCREVSGGDGSSSAGLISVGLIVLHWATQGFGNRVYVGWEVSPEGGLLERGSSGVLIFVNGTWENCCRTA